MSIASADQKMRCRGAPGDPDIFPQNVCALSAPEKKETCNQFRNTLCCTWLESCRRSNFMSRTMFYVAAALAVSIVLPVSAAEPALNSFGFAVAPQGGNASIHQWGGVDDSFAVNPDGEPAPAPSNGKAASLAQNQDDAQNDPGDPDADHTDEVLPI
jgi:hypothetical protein